MDTLVINVYKQRTTPRNSMFNSKCTSIAPSSTYHQVLNLHSLFIVRMSYDFKISISWHRGSHLIQWPSVEVIADSPRGTAMTGQLEKVFSKMKPVPSFLFHWNDQHSSGQVLSHHVAHAYSKIYPRKLSILETRWLRHDSAPETWCLPFGQEARGRALKPVPKPSAISIYITYSRQFQSFYTSVFLDNQQAPWNSSYQPQIEAIWQLTHLKRSNRSRSPQPFFSSSHASSFLVYLHLYVARDLQRVQASLCLTCL